MDEKIEIRINELQSEIAQEQQNAQRIQILLNQTHNNILFKQGAIAELIKLKGDNDEEIRDEPKQLKNSESTETV